MSWCSVARKPDLLCPEGVRIFGRTYSFSDESANGLGQDRLGSCDNIFQVITRDLNQSPIEFADTTLHEVFHAICYTMRVTEDMDIEEKYVAALATGLMGVLQDNPEFAKWLIAQRAEV